MLTERISTAFGLLTEKLGGWLEQAILITPNLAVALLVMVLAALLGMAAYRLSKRILSRFLKNLSLVRFLSTLIRLCVILAGAIVALNVLQLEKAVLSVLTGVGILGIALGFAFQDMAANFISGIALVLRDDKPFKVGDVVEAGEHIGVIHEINLRATTIETFQGQHVFLPNKQLFQEPVINYSFLGKRRIDLEVGVSYGDDLEKVERVTLDAVREIGTLADEPVKLYYSEFGDSSINFVVMFWIRFVGQADFLAARSNAIKAIKVAYDHEDITIPFPIRTLDFGIKGGTRLSEEVPPPKSVDATTA